MMEIQISEIFISAGISVGTVFVAIKFLGKKWLENKFSKDLEEFKVKKTHEFNVLLNQETKWKDKEFEILSTSWMKLVDAYDALSCSVSLLRECPDFSKWPESDIRSFLDGGTLNQGEKKYFKGKQGQEMNAAYLHILEYRNLNDLNTFFNKFRKYLDHNRIFLHPDIKEIYKKIESEISTVSVIKSMSLNEHPSGEESKLSIDSYRKLKNDIDPLMLKIENALQHKLFPNAGTDAN